MARYDKEVIMETRACIKSLIDDMNQYGRKRNIVVNTFDMVSNGLFVGCLCDYKIDDSQIERTHDFTTGGDTFSCTIEYLLFDQSSPLVMSRIYSYHGTQYKYDVSEVLNNDKLRICKESGEGGVYMAYAEKACRTKDIDVSIRECVDQDLMIFGEETNVYVKCKAVDESEVVIDWYIMSPFIDKKDIPVDSDEYIIESTLSGLSQAIDDQGAGIKKKAKKAKVLSFSN